MKRFNENLMLVLVTIAMIAMVVVLSLVLFGMTAQDAEASETCWGFTCTKSTPPTISRVPEPPQQYVAPLVPLLVAPRPYPAYPSLRFLHTPQGPSVIHQVNPGLTVITGPQKTTTCVTVGRVVSCQ